ncbi:hypothetical protein D3C81_1369760 [compost metagenome]
MAASALSAYWGFRTVWESGAVSSWRYSRHWGTVPPGMSPPSFFSKALRLPVPAGTAALAAAALGRLMIAFALARDATDRFCASA